MKEGRFEMEGEIIDCLPNTQFKVMLENGHECICTLSGVMRKNYIRIIKGDKVTIDMSSYDLNKGRIIWRNK